MSRDDTVLYLDAFDGKARAERVGRLKTVGAQPPRLPDGPLADALHHLTLAVDRYARSTALEPAAVLVTPAHPFATTKLAAVYAIPLIVVDKLPGGAPLLLAYPTD